MTKIKYTINLLKKYAKENKNIVRSTSDLSELEEWLILELYKNYEGYKDDKKRT